ncbi:MAG: hypothetical protein KatS3mg114_0512 [Planctomycetaceae bacterium]|nr:MAG: hypothetical protein KatS3mg114_0512 [Planctomycetaceae bacterium]
MIDHEHIDPSGYETQTEKEIGYRHNDADERLRSNQQGEFGPSQLHRL